MRRTVMLVLLVTAATLAASARGSTSASTLTLMLDWTPNPDHVGLYYARAAGLFSRAGLDVAIHAPSDPTTPLKLVAAGRTDLAVSYEQEVFFASAKKLPVVAVAAVVPQPLNSIMSIEPRIRTTKDLKGARIGITGVPADYAALDTALGAAGLSRGDVTTVTVGYNLLPALLSHRVDAVLGVYRNVEGVELAQRGLRATIIPLDRAGVPSYDELVLVANADRLRTDAGYAGEVRRFVGAFVEGTVEARTHPARALSVLEHVTASSKRFLARATPATLALLTGRRGVGCLAAADWRRFGAWLQARSLLAQPLDVSSVMTTRFLPARCRA
jgi:putative hydroxymethylpyrimidine transport system substrate-binding protein